MVTRPANEADRLEALRRLRIVDTADERDFDDIVRMASLICGTPMAGISLVEAERQWFKASLGIEARELRREDSFCSYTILQPDVFEVYDLAADARFATSAPVAGPSGFRSYAAAPLVTRDGYAIGTVCVLDRRPLELTADQRAALAALARQAMAQIELREQLSLAKDALARVGESERALRASERRWRGLVENTWDVIALIGEDRRVAYVSPAVRDVLGYAPTELTGMTAAALLSPADAEQAGVDLAAVTTAPGASAGPVRVRARHASGRTVVLEVAVLNRTDDPDLRGFVVNARDVTDLVTANEELRLSSRMRDEFVMVAGHELRSPVAAIQAGLDTVALRWERLDDATRHELIEPVRAQARRLDRMVQNVLTLSAVDTGALLVERSPVAVVDVVNEAVAAAEARDVDVRCDPALMVHADGERAVEMVRRLLTNAAMYGAPPVVVEAVEDGDAVVIAVEDSGPGVPEEFRPRLFERFAQHSLGTTRIAAGMGLGLASVRALAEAHGGKAWYEPREGGGARFAVRLPRAGGGD